MGTHVARQKRPEGRLFARVIKAGTGEIIDLGHIAGGKISRKEAKKGRDGRKRLNALAKEAGHNGR